jgi:hypothetical protein
MTPVVEGGMPAALVIVYACLVMVEVAVVEVQGLVTQRLR